MSLRSELEAALGRISTPAKETRDLLVILGEWIGSTNAGNIGPHKTWYVDPDATGLPVDGKTWSRAFTTMEAALDACSDGDWVLLAGNLTESVAVTSYADGPHFITIKGASDSIRRPTWEGDGTAPILALRGHGWVIRDIRFVVPAGHAGLYLEMSAAGGAYQTKVENCYFFGLAATKAGIELWGAPNTCIIKDCWFDMFITGTGIVCLSTGHAAPYRCMFIKNRFTDCQNQINLWGANSCMFLENILPGQGHSVATIRHLYLESSLGHSNDNVVSKNVLGGDYSTDNDSYLPGANDCWVGNYAEDIAACPSGITLGVPTPG